MKPRATGFAIICALAALAATATAQISITSTDVSTQFSVGNFLTNRFDSTATSANIGHRGSSSWDFSGLLKSGPKVNVVKLTSVALSTAFSASSFPAATHALQTNIVYVYQGTPLAATAYLFFNLSGNLMNLGESATVQGGAATLLATNSPADLFYTLPSTYGTTWKSKYFDTTNIYLGGFFVSGTGAHHSASYAVDAYGTLKIPDGTTHDVLRIRKVDTVQATSTSGAPVTIGVGYIFIAKDGTLVQVSAANTSDPDSGTIAVYPPISWTAAVNTSAPLASPLPQKFSLEQNYPNPFNPSTVIAYDLPTRSRVVLAVYNVLGQKVAELVNGDVPAGSHTVEWRPQVASGVYLCRIDAVSLEGPAAHFAGVETGSGEYGRESEFRGKEN